MHFSQHTVEQLKKENHLIFEELAILKHPVDCEQVETQTDDDQHEKLVEVNNELERVLQTLKDKLHEFGTERQNLFDGIGEETSDRLDHLISTINSQATQINFLNTERDQLEEQLQNKNKELQR
jgi:chromosome segregation ATPase